ncbi:hypothetical protein [Embleya sp. MST-111070]|uniref:hypothetical protein n=1 Tax=Embleya sp. MST-111070 TaxID=3398231 RepID=UPI003F735105
MGGNTHTTFGLSTPCSTVQPAGTAKVMRWRLCRVSPPEFGGAAAARVPAVVGTVAAMGAVPPGVPPPDDTRPPAEGRVEGVSVAGGSVRWVAGESSWTSPGTVTAVPAAGWQATTAAAIGPARPRLRGSAQGEDA